jgi:xanthine dehydrogenase YagS FAD-binding subunit
VALELDGDRVLTARIALGGIATRPWRAHEAEQLLAGHALDEATAAEAADAALASATPHEDNNFKIELGRRTLVRALLETKAMELAA